MLIQKHSLSNRSSSSYNNNTKINTYLPCPPFNMNNNKYSSKRAPMNHPLISTCNENNSFSKPLKSILKNSNPNLVYESPNSLSTNSNRSSKDSLVTQRTNSTVASSVNIKDSQLDTIKINNQVIPSEDYPNFTYNARKSNSLSDFEDDLIDLIHNHNKNMSSENLHGRKKSITSSIKVGNHFNEINNINKHTSLYANNSNISSKYSIHSCKKTSIKPVPKNNIILINNMPYPVQIQFPAKISKRNSKPNNSINNDLDNTNISYFKDSNMETVPKALPEIPTFDSNETFPGDNSFVGDDSLVVNAIASYCNTTKDDDDDIYYSHHTNSNGHIPTYKMNQAEKDPLLDIIQFYEDI